MGLLLLNDVFAKTASKKIGALINEVFLLRLLCIPINLPDSLAWNTVAMSGLVVLAGGPGYY